MPTVASTLPTMPQHVYVGVQDDDRWVPDTETYDIWPKFVINIYLQGRHSFSIDGVQFSGDAGCENAPRPRALMVNVKQYAKLRYNNSGIKTPLRKVMTSAPLIWLEREMGSGREHSPALGHFFSTHLSHFAFDAPPDLVDLAEQICHPPLHLRGELHTLYCKSRGIEIMRLACAALVTAADSINHRPSAMTAQKSEQVRSYVLANLTRDLTIEDISQACGASASSVQRYFKQQYGVTVFEFIRRKRLESARDALQCRGVTVAQAAWIAGYTHASSFVTAFKRAFGICPGEIRA